MYNILNYFTFNSILNCSVVIFNLSISPFKSFLHFSYFCKVFTNPCTICSYTNVLYIFMFIHTFQLKTIMDNMFVVDDSIKHNI